MCAVCAHAGIFMPRRECEGQRTIFGGWFSPCRSHLFLLLCFIFQASWPMNIPPSLLWLPPVLLEKYYCYRCVPLYLWVIRLVLLMPSPAAVNCVCSACVYECECVCVMVWAWRSENTFQAFALLPPC